LFTFYFFLSIPNFSGFLLHVFIFIFYKYGWCESKKPSCSAFQLFALYWGPGNLYPLVVFVLIHMFISGIVHTLFSGRISLIIILKSVIYSLSSFSV
jgi:hypothetical protein